MGAGRGVEAMLKRLPPGVTPASASAPTSRATASTTRGRIPTGTACDLDLAEFATDCRAHDRRACQRAAREIRSTRCATISPTTKARPGCWCARSRPTTSATSCARPALVGSDGNCVAPYGTVAGGLPHPRLLRHLPAHHRPPCRRTARIAAGARDPQNDWRDRARSSSRIADCFAKASRPTLRSSTRTTSATAPPTTSRTSFRPARAPP